MRDGVVERGVDLGRDLGGGEFVVAHGELRRLEIDAVEAAERIAHAIVAALAHVVDQLADRPP